MSDVLVEDRKGGLNMNQTWTIDASHTDASFTVKHMGLLNVRGTFNQTTGKVVIDEKGVLVSAEAIIDVQSLSTRDAQRDAHLMQDDFFGAARHPQMKLVSTAVKKVGMNTYEVQANLTLKGVTKPVTFDVTLLDEIKDPFGMRRRALEATTRINRKEWGMTYNQFMDNGGLLVANDVKISIEAEITQ